MLCLTLSPGEYLTVGEDVVLVLDRTTGDRCKLLIDAPREIPIVRGEVREREGYNRPDNVYDMPRWRTRELPWDRSKGQALAAMRKLLDEMDGGDRKVRALRRQLEHMFPKAEKAAVE